VSRVAAARLDDTLAALADPTRRRMVDLLRSRARRADELAAALRMSPSVMRRDLRVLRTRGLVEEEGVAQDARVRVFLLRREPFGDVQTWLGEVEMFWSDQLGSFKAGRARTRKAGRQ